MTRFELDKLQLGWIVRQEQQAEQMDAQASGMTTEQYRRKQGRTARARQHFAESRGLA